jgi:hypothetical protein
MGANIWRNICGRDWGQQGGVAPFIGHIAGRERTTRAASAEGLIFRISGWASLGPACCGLNFKIGTMYVYKGTLTERPKCLT